jgi:signal peptidase II
MTRWLCIASVLVVLDQLTKYAITHSIAYGSGVEITPFFNLVLVHNKGAAFSFLSSASGWQREFFVAIAVIAIAWVVYLLRRHPEQTLFCFALSLILGGAVGNVIDRVWLGAVIDFLDFHAAGHHFPAFNVADSAITCGAAALLWDSFRSKETRPA